MTYEPTDEMIEKVDAATNYTLELYDIRKVIAAAAPLILEQAAKVADEQGAEDEKDYDDSSDPASGHGAYRSEAIAAAIRKLGEP